MEVALVYLWYAVQVLVGYNLILPLILFVCYSFFRSKKNNDPKESFPADYAIVVTAYRYTRSLPAVVSSLLKLKYHNFLIYIVADNCDSKLLSFSDERVVVLQPESILSSNIRSHFYGIHRFKRKHDRITIIDSDNLVDPEYLNELNLFFDQGFQAVQGIRKPRNLETTLACLDAARDLYYHFYDGRVLFSLGSSATLSGSGMAFTVSLYRECLEDLSIDGAGFDKVLQSEIVKRGYRIAFAEKAVVYDAKTSKAAELVNQRSRWIGTWFSYYRFSVQLILSGIRKFNFNQSLFGLILFRPPLFIFLLLSVAIWLINLFIDPVVQWVWLAGLVLFTIGFLIALIMSPSDRRIYRAFIYIPHFIILQILALSKYLLKKKGPVSTKHSLP